MNSTLKREIQVLIVGLLPYDSGKTSLAESLVIEATQRGLDVGVSKPISAVSGWYQYEYLVRSIEFGILVGEDMHRLHNAAKSSDPLEVEGPFVSLLMPPDPERVDWQSSVYMALSLLDQIVVMRVTGIEGTKHFYVPLNIRKLSNTLKEEVEKLLRSLHPKAVAVGREFTNEMLLKSYEIADECLDYIANKHEFVVVESYNNAAAPTHGSLNATAVVAITPSKAAIYEGDLYRKALIAISDIKEPRQTTTEEILRLLKPAKTIELKPLGKSRLVEGLLDAILNL